MQLFPGELALANLRGEISEDERGQMSRESAFALLREVSGLDFGENIEKWEKWVQQEYAQYRRNFPPRD